MIIKLKKGIRAFNEIKYALDATLSDSLISQKVYD
jgi:hypothetical protein